MIKGALYGNLLVLLITVVYGVNTPLMKTILPEWIDAYALTTIRQMVVALLFWVTALFIPSVKIEWKHFLYIAIAGVFGISLNQFCFAMGLTHTSPVDASILRSFTPIIVIAMSVLFFGRLLTKRLVIGVVLGILGAVLIILFGDKGAGTAVASHGLYGNLLVLLSVLGMGIYLIVIKRVAGKYHPIHVMKWVFTIAAFSTLPFTYQHILDAPVFHRTMEWSVVLRLVYIIVLATYFAYLLNFQALKYISSTRESLYSYLQPVVATFVAILIGQDKLTFIDPISLGLIFLSFYVINHKPAVKKES